MHLEMIARILVVQNSQLDLRRLHSYSLLVLDELRLINRVIDIIGNSDLDIVVGWEVQAASWGYVSTSVPVALNIVGCP